MLRDVSAGHVWPETFSALNVVAPEAFVVVAFIILFAKDARHLKRAGFA
ncbi:hypothetical protein [Pseudomonas sp. CCC2.2]|nr:hypothetical protein [Pseudomonas sp. CCC2.2]MEB0146792.1 hypothetical protein [Pseudomonas sp. CCC2.2]